MLKVFGQLVLGLGLSYGGFLFFLAYKFGAFNTINPLNTDKCHRIQIDRPSEDVAVLKDGSVLFALDAMGDYLGFMNWWSQKDWAERVADATTETGRATIAMLSEDAQSVTDVPVLGLRLPDLHPHGLATLELENDEFLLIVNHARERDVITVLRAVKENGNLHHFQHINDVTFIEWSLLNNLAPVPGSKTGAFYLTNWMKNDPASIAGTMELVSDSRWSHLFLCAEQTSIFEPSSNGTLSIDCRIVGSDLENANGVAVSQDGLKVFVSEPGVNNIKVFERNPSTNDLKWSHDIDTEVTTDNLSIQPETGDLIGACFPKGNSGSRVIRVQSPQFDAAVPIYEGNGTWLAGCSGAHYSLGRLVASSLSDAAVLVCEGV